MIRSPNGWTLDTLAKHLTDKINGVEDRTQERFSLSKQAIDSALAASEKGITAAMASADKAVSKAEMASEKRFESVNEFRAAMKDQTANFADKDQIDFRLNAVEKKLETMTIQTQSMFSIVAFIIGGIGLAVSISVLVGKFIH